MYMIEKREDTKVKQLRAMYESLRSYLHSVTFPSPDGGNSERFDHVSRFAILRAFEDVVDHARVTSTDNHGGVVSLVYDHLPEAKRLRTRESLCILQTFHLLVDSTPDSQIVRVNRHVIESFWYVDKPHIKRVAYGHRVPTPIQKN